MRVAVVGGGVLGMSIAHHLARRGAGVVLATENTLASEASGRSLSWLNSWAVRSPWYHELRLEGIARYRALQPVVGKQWLRFDGGLAWGDTDEIYAHHQAIGYPTSRVPSASGVVVPPGGALYNPLEGWVDLPSLIAYLRGQFSGRIVEQAGPVRLATEGSRVTGIHAFSQFYGADVVVLATGASVPVALGEFGLSIGAATAPAVLVHTAPVRTGLEVVVNTPEISLRPTPNGGLALGAAWAEKEVHADGSVDSSTVDKMLAAARAVLSGHPELSASFVGAGLKPIPADDEPVLGPVPSVDRLYVAFTHSGATLALIIGELVAGEILTGKADPRLARYRVDRFVTT
ncbi:FAD-binding oxidoreductase [Actinocrispum sp. NPDC049592]|uniref:NAD(P)/FAD-dependent oxidoreductase n=1 Tax=Actinocrispum sp. NPDC049592 TaxID=3154835 RepID=UPI0034340BEB